MTSIEFTLTSDTDITVDGAGFTSGETKSFSFGADLNTKDFVIIVGTFSGTRGHFVTLTRDTVDLLNGAGFEHTGGKNRAIRPI